MGFIPSSCFPLKIQSFTAFFIFFLILISTHARFMPQGLWVRFNFFNFYTHTYSWSPVSFSCVYMERASLLIGSRPPRCEKTYCSNCGHCEAVQVPIVPKYMRTTQRALGTTPKSILDSRGDDISNYKPMCWKCKCGDFMFNP
ncbi:hypothetical protein SSX86_011400 [Deinandra increscens subsp. villosa]|uniref:Epidermal patterning factor-like protein n=1 Tax=Deinandra increscens subsp. villosa TaxID=3103831 RepID=A0AAP0H1Y4_9ASTR